MALLCLLVASEAQHLHAVQQPLLGDSVLPDCSGLTKTASFFQQGVRVLFLKSETGNALTVSLPFKAGSTNSHHHRNHESTCYLGSNAPPGVLSQQAAVFAQSMLCNDTSLDIHQSTVQCSAVQRSAALRC